MPFVEMVYKCSRTGDTVTEKIEVVSLGECLTEATEECKRLLENFNEVEKERYGKHANLRELLNVKPCKVSFAERKHQWEKVNLVTVQGKDGLYDLLRCKRCGAEFKRYGVTDPPSRGCFPKRRPRKAKSIPKQSKNTLEGWDKIIRGKK